MRSLPACAGHRRAARQARRSRRARRADPGARPPFAPGTGHSERRRWTAGGEQRSCERSATTPAPAPSRAPGLPPASASTRGCAARSTLTAARRCTRAATAAGAVDRLPGGARAARDRELGRRSLRRRPPPLGVRRGCALSRVRHRSDAHLGAEKSPARASRAPPVRAARSPARPPATRPRRARDSSTRGSSSVPGAPAWLTQARRQRPDLQGRDGASRPPGRASRGAGNDGGFIDVGAAPALTGAVSRGGGDSAARL